MKNSFYFIVVLVLISATTGFGVTPSFQGLGYLPGDNGSGACGISADGSVVVGTSYSGSDGQAFRWTASTGMVGLPYLPGDTDARANGVSADGSTVVGYSEATVGTTKAFRWTSGGGTGNLGGMAGVARSCSANGSVVVGRSSAGAFRWTASTGMASLGGSDARSVSADGSVVVGGTGTQAFRWTASTGMVGLGFLPGSSYSGANGVSADGLVVVGQSQLGPESWEAFRWTASSGMVGLGDLPGGSFSSAATAVSANGSVVVGQGDGVYGGEPFYWTASDGMRSLRDILTNDCHLNVTGWSLAEPTGLSADGLTIVGVGFDSTGHQRGWVATIPEPATLLLLGLGGMMMRSRKS
jgi:probable HAF family extracellular repeat protein